jgi:hypothetical protein
MNLRRIGAAGFPAAEKPETAGTPLLFFDTKRKKNTGFAG